MLPPRQTPTVLQLSREAAEQQQRLRSQKRTDVVERAPTHVNLRGSASEHRLPSSATCRGHSNPTESTSSEHSAAPRQAQTCTAEQTAAHQSCVCLARDCQPTVCNKAAKGIHTSHSKAPLTTSNQHRCHAQGTTWWPALETVHHNGRGRETLSAVASLSLRDPHRHINHQDN